MKTKRIRRQNSEKMVSLRAIEAERFPPRAKSHKPVNFESHYFSIYKSCDHAVDYIFKNLSMKI